MLIPFLQFSLFRYILGVFLKFSLTTYFIIFRISIIHLFHDIPLILFFSSGYWPCLCCNLFSFLVRYLPLFYLDVIIYFLKIHPMFLKPNYSLLTVNLFPNHFPSFFSSLFAPSLLQTLLTSPFT